MSSSSSGQLPKLGVLDFAPGKDHLVEICHQGKVIALVHKDDPVRPILPLLQFAENDLYAYLFIHGGQTRTRFENREFGTHEIPDHVVAALLSNQYGSQLDGMSIRVCACYGNMKRPGDTRTAVQGLASLLPKTSFQGYHGLVRVLANPAELRLGLSIQWDATVVPPGPVVIGPPGNWEPIIP
jgi:hypothetical protein